MLCPPDRRSYTYNDANAANTHSSGQRTPVVPEAQVLVAVPGVGLVFAHTEHEPSKYGSETDEGD